MRLLVSELGRVQNARCNDNKKKCILLFNKLLLLSAAWCVVRYEGDSCCSAYKLIPLLSHEPKVSLTDYVMPVFVLVA